MYHLAFTMYCLTLIMYRLAFTTYRPTEKFRRFGKILRRWGTNRLGETAADGMKNLLGEVPADEAKNLVAQVVCDFSSACEQALTVYTKEDLPHSYANTLSLLGIAYQNANQFPTAYNTFESAIATIESLREEIVSGEESKRKQAEEFNQIYSYMVEVCLKLDKKTEAIEYVERSKTRNLVEQILERDYKTIFPPAVVTQLETYKD
jgi:tetratricopeptide (TPR) repeat protein